MARARPAFPLLLALAAALLLLAGPAAAAAAYTGGEGEPRRNGGSGGGAGGSHHAPRPAPPPATAPSQTGQKPLAHLAAEAGLAFSGSGFLAVFHLGAWDALQDLGLATRETRVAGTSGGSLVSGLSCLGVPQQDAWAVAQSINDECRGEWSCAGRLDAAVRKAMRAAVDRAMAAAGLRPDTATQTQRDGFVVGRCAGRATFNMSLVTPSLLPGAAVKGATSWPVSNFTGEDDFARAGEASSFIPLFSGRWHGEFRGLAVVDGMFSSGLPPRCVDGSVRHCVSIKAVIKESGAADISPGQYSPLPDGFTPKTWQDHAAVAPSEKMARDMRQHGYDQAVAWACKAHPRSMASTGMCSGGKETRPPRKMLPGQWHVPALG